jgi:hypothetical protein
MSNIKILNMGWLQVGPKDSGSQIFSFLAFKTGAVGEVQILRTATATATATARDSWIFLSLKLCYLFKKSPKILNSPNFFF